MTDNLHDETAAADRFALYEAHAKAHGLTVPQLRALEAVCAHPGCTQTALCSGGILTRPGDPGDIRCWIWQSSSPSP